MALHTSGPSRNSKPKIKRNQLDLEVTWLDQAKDAVLQTDAREVVVDFRYVEVIRSEDLSELIRLQSKLRQTGRTLVLDNVQAHLWNIFIVTRLDRLFEVRQAAELQAT